MNPTITPLPGIVKTGKVKSTSSLETIEGGAGNAARCLKYMGGITSFTASQRRGDSQSTGISRTVWQKKIFNALNIKCIDAPY